MAQFIYVTVKVEDAWQPMFFNVDDIARFYDNENETKIHVRGNVDISLFLQPTNPNNAAVEKRHSWIVQESSEAIAQAISADGVIGWATPKPSISEAETIAASIQTPTEPCPPEKEWQTPPSIVYTGEGFTVAFTSQAPMLDKMQWSKSNRPLAHVFREVTDMDGVGGFDIDGQMPDLKVSSQAGDAKLTPFGGRMEIGEDTARLMGGADAFFREQSVLLAKEGGMRLEKAFFEKIVTTATEKNRCFSYNPDVPPAANPDTTTVAVVTWSPYDTCALYSPAFQKTDGDFWELEKYYKGAVYPNRDGINVYGAYLKLAGGLLLANPKAYCVIRNVPLGMNTKDFPKNFVGIMADLIEEVTVNEQTTIIMARHYKVRLAAATAQFGTTNALLQYDTAFNMRIAGIPVIAASNIPLHYRLSTEAVA
jgi:hypothetical protein